MAPNAVFVGPSRCAVNKTVMLLVWHRGMILTIKTHQYFLRNASIITSLERGANSPVVLLRKKDWEKAKTAGPCLFHLFLFHISCKMCISSD